MGLFNRSAWVSSHCMGYNLFAWSWRWVGFVIFNTSKAWLNYTKPRNCSSMWSKICMVGNEVECQFQWLIGFGESVNLYADPRISTLPFSLAYLTWRLKILICIFHHLITMDRSWNVDSLMQFFCSKMMVETCSIVSTTCSTQDVHRTTDRSEGALPRRIEVARHQSASPTPLIANHGTSQSMTSPIITCISTKKYFKRWVMAAARSPPVFSGIEGCHLQLSSNKKILAGSTGGNTLMLKLAWEDEVGNSCRSSEPWWLCKHNSEEYECTYT